jgi:hypothetical protein
LEKHRDSLEAALGERERHWVWRLYVALQQLMADAIEDLWNWKWVIVLIIITFLHLLVAREQLVIETLQLQVVQGQNAIARKELAQLGLIPSVIT